MKPAAVHDGRPEEARRIVAAASDMPRRANVDGDAKADCHWREVAKARLGTAVAKTVRRA